MISNTVCFYHSADLDGHCSGAIVKMKYPDCEMIGIDYGHEVPWEKVKGQDVVMVDFCLQPFTQKMVRLIRECRTLLWIDHHQTEMDEYREWIKGKDIPEAKFKAVLPENHHKEAACELVWKYFNPGLVMPTFIFLLGRYDIWDLNADQRVMAFQWGMRMFENTYPDNQEFWESLLDYERTMKIVEDGSLILKFRDSQNVKIMSATSFETEFEGLKFVASNVPLCNSQTFDSVYDPEKHDGMLSFYWKPKSNAFTVSLYTTKDIDMSAIAKKHGGGGHKQAAGFQCRFLPFELNGK